MMKPTERLSVLEERVSQWIQSTEDYRRQKDECSRLLFSKIDMLVNKMSDLPCRERAGTYSSIKGQLAAIWMFVVAGMGLVIKHFYEAK